MKVRFKFNLLDLLFYVTVFLFIFSEFTTSITIIDNFFDLMEKFKIKYIFAFFCSLIFLLKNSFILKKYFFKETKYYLLSAFILMIISFILQCIHGFKGDWINETLYFIVPVIFAYTYINSKNGDIDKSIDAIFYAVILIFLLTFSKDLSIKSILSINFVESYSPFEGGPAFLSLMLMFYYKYSGKKLNSIISMLICILSFKRVTAIFCVLIFFLFDKIKTIKWNKNIIVICVFFSIVPFILRFICNEGFSIWFNSVTNLDLNTFVKGRFSFINTVVDSNSINYGLGSCRLYLTSILRNVHHTNAIYDLHCDILRFNLECGFIGSFCMLFCYFKSASKSNLAVFLMIYVFIESCVNHVFGAGNTLYWILIYLIIFILNRDEERKMEKERKYYENRCNYIS